jgi:hypothetical protein
MSAQSAAILTIASPRYGSAEKLMSMAPGSTETLIHELEPEVTVRLPPGVPQGLLDGLNAAVCEAASRGAPTTLTEYSPEKVNVALALTGTS